MGEAHARILLWGIAGAGKSTTLHTIHARLRPESRGELVRQPSRLDPTVFAESLSISLGDLGGKAMQIELVAVPGAPDQVMTRKQLLDRVDGVVLVLDCAPDRIDANTGALDELRSSLAAYGQRIEALPLVLQYNKRDVADPFAIEALHRKLGLRDAAVFETIATTGHGVLPALTTISKHVVRQRRGGAESRSGTESRPARPAPVVAPVAAAARTHEILEAGILAEAESPSATGSGLGVAASASPDALALDFDRTTQPDWNAVQRELAKPETELGAALRIVSAGQASVDAEGRLRLPLVVGDQAGATRSLVLELRLADLVGAGGS